MADQNKLVVIYNNLEKLLDSKREAMPTSFNKTRFLQNCMTVLQETKDIELCNPTTVARTMLKGAFLGLDFFNKECYAVVYKGSVEFQTDYKGEVKLAKKYSTKPVREVYAKLVREGDEFAEEINSGNQTINFRPKPFNNEEILGAFAVVNYMDGTMAYDIMSKEEIEKIKENFSRKSKQTGEYSKAWVVTPGEMYKKTVLRRLCKNIDLDFDTIEQRQAFEDAGDVDFNQEVKPAQQSPLNSTVIEAEFEEVSEEQTNAAEQE
ncbi:RecT family recombinase [Brevibacillus porteri]|uniref:Recombinase n=1 Tax=Brevibacillus porteri TaxID=2126350 RepID=A0ABX5FUY2_9BACL|nr:RecT family recombinase [Brevibacillus porteri]MED1801327.1 recombinase RecT [Brevibacillus porteri]MED2135034.1 recombinase RecT [Brevibacillus porteri]MED2745131.1 recombinase RecT [Brevibacillus porteri]MED2813425.1 recombinase RecT [Brevibacillus porteri]MED2897962.1 recombinase RecT [Brevibacillus porteri]